MIQAEGQKKTETADGCPVPHDSKTIPPSAHASKRLEVDADGVWHIYGFAEARQVLRNEFAHQAGFLAETVLNTGGRSLTNPPILYLEGEEHHRARRETNKFFTPTITNREYRDFMNEYADQLMDALKQNKRADLSDLSMDMAVMVASQIVGLTSSILPGKKSRLERIIDKANDFVTGGTSLLSQLFSQWTTLAFYLFDVLPAIRARRKNPQQDVISYLLERGYSNLEILTECIVYGVAGMVTTREFISVAFWHLMENPHLQQRMLVGEQEERYAILHEILRLEPVVSHLYRRAKSNIDIETDGDTVTIPEGAQINLHITSTNMDESAVGEPGGGLCPMREMTAMRPKVPEFVLSFGEGAHRCPGAFVAIQETDIFLRKLLEQPGLRMEKAPDVNQFEIAESYEIRNFIIAVD